MAKLTKISLSLQTLFADLVQKCADAEFDANFPETGSIAKRSVKGKDFYYYTAGSTGADRARKQIYIGPASDPEVAKRVEGFQHIKSNFKERRGAVTALQAIGLPRPTGATADVVERLWKAGFFRLRGVMVGTEAFQTFGGILGVKLSGTYTITGDANFAQFHSVSLAIGEGGDSLPPILDLLREIDPTFNVVVPLNRSDPPAKFRNAMGYLVEFLTRNQGDLPPDFWAI